MWAALSSYQARSALPDPHTTPGSCLSLSPCLGQPPALPSLRHPSSQSRRILGSKYPPRRPARTLTPLATRATCPHPPPALPCPVPAPSSSPSPIPPEPGALRRDLTPGHWPSPGSGFGVRLQVAPSHTRPPVSLTSLVHLQSPTLEKLHFLPARRLWPGCGGGSGGPRPRGHCSLC